VVSVWTTIAVERPTIAHHADLVHVEIAHDELVLECVANFTNKLAFWVYEIALTIEVVGAVLCFDTNAVDRADLIHVCNSRSWLLEAPDVFRQTTACCRWVEHNFCTVESECTPAFWEVAVVTDVHANFANCSIKNWVTMCARCEVVLLPKTRNLRNVLLAILAEVTAISIDHCCCVVVQTWLHDFVHWQHQHHPQLFCKCLEALGGWAVRDWLGVREILWVLLLAEVWAIE